MQAVKNDEKKLVRGGRIQPIKDCLHSADNVTSQAAVKLKLNNEGFFILNNFPLMNL